MRLGYCRVSTTDQNLDLQRDALQQPVRPGVNPQSRLPGQARWQQRWRALLSPLDREKRRALKTRWEELPASLRTINQVSGRQFTHCGFTLGASYCSFHCTHCYLPEAANAAPIPSLAEMREQINANRRFQGPGGGFQITGGDVADAYWRAGRSDELVEIIRHTISAGLVPILMTHGQILIEEPALLERLIVEGGLRQVSVHIDMTQAGRRGYPIQKVVSETDLHPVREAFTQLAHEMQKRTGVRLRLAHTCTVCRRNLDSVPDILRWFLAKPERTRLWRMLSFQPEADTGRTLFSSEPVTPAQVWEKICEGAGLRLERHGALLGHPDCNSWAPLLVTRPSGRVLPLLMADAASMRIFSQVLDAIGGISLAPDDHGLFPFRLAGALMRHPFLLWRICGRLLRLTLNRTIPPHFLIALLRARSHPVNIYMHNFMSSAQVASAANLPIIAERLQACVFKGAVKHNGRWMATPMCSMNQVKWRNVLAERQNRK